MIRSEFTFDVIIIGGALSGSSTALLLLEKDPAIRVLIVEKSSAFKRRVGESTVEISAFFLGKVLGLSGHLAEHHLVKQGLRFWFANKATVSLADCSEIGPKYQVRLPGYQVDRAVLDEELLARARNAGATIMRPAKVTDYSLQPGGTQQVRIAQEDKMIECRARWLIDASGLTGTIARRQGWIRRNEEHPIASLWSRWQGVKNWDSTELARRHPQWSDRVQGTRNTATNHLCGQGWWAWMIPLKGGDVSIGVVYDTRLMTLEPGPVLGERLKKLLVTHPAGAEMLRDASFQPDDVTYRNHLAYVSNVFAEDGVALVGDAAAFMDPFYSPGMDWIAFSTLATTNLILDSRRRGGVSPSRLCNHNAGMATSYRRWFAALYKDKYYYMGDYELMLLAFKLDLGLYYFGIVRGPLTGRRHELFHPPFSEPVSRPFFALMRWYNSRLATIGRNRMAQGRWGRHNSGKWFPFDSYTFDSSLVRRICSALLSYAWLEVREFFSRSRSTHTLPGAADERTIPQTHSGKAL